MSFIGGIYFVSSIFHLSLSPPPPSRSQNTLSALQAAKNELLRDAIIANGRLRKWNELFMEGLPPAVPLWIKSPPSHPRRQSQCSLRRGTGPKRLPGVLADLKTTASCSVQTTERGALSWHPFGSHRTGTETGHEVSGPEPRGALVALGGIWYLEWDWKLQVAHWTFHVVAVEIKPCDPSDVTHIHRPYSVRCVYWITISLCTTRFLGVI